MIIIILYKSNSCTTLVSFYIYIYVCVSFCLAVIEVFKGLVMKRQEGLDLLVLLQVVVEVVVVHVYLVESLYTSNLHVTCVVHQIYQLEPN